jgi:hypothetical protein
MICAHTAIIPKNRVSEAKVAASSMTARLMQDLQQEQNMTNIHDLFQSVNPIMPPS